MNIRIPQGGILCLSTGKDQYNNKVKYWIKHPSIPDHKHAVYGRGFNLQ